MSNLLRRYVPPTPLPTPISDSVEMLDEAETEIPSRSEPHQAGGER